MPLTDAGGSLPAWLPLGVTSGTLAPGESATVQMTMDASASTAEGREATALTRSSNATAEDDAIGGTHELGLPTPNPSRSVTRVAALYDGSVAAGSRLGLELRDGSLSANAYVPRVTGGGFADARRLTVTR